MHVVYCTLYVALRVEALCENTLCSVLKSKSSVSQNPSSFLPMQ